MPLSDFAPTEHKAQRLEHFEVSFMHLQWTTPSKAWKQPWRTISSKQQNPNFWKRKRVPRGKLSLHSQQVKVWLTVESWSKLVKHTRVEMEFWTKFSC